MPLAWNTCVCRKEVICCKVGQAHAFLYFRKQHTAAWISFLILRKGSTIKLIAKCAKPFMVILHNVQFQRMLEFLLKLCYHTDQCWWTLHVITMSSCWISQRSHKKKPCRAHWNQWKMLLRHLKHHIPVVYLYLAAIWQVQYVKNKC